ncbi:hypothetical protein EJB05_36902, partial [Eragrostis curvula]
MGIIARDHTGGVVFASGRVLFHCASAEEAELMACREGLHLALQWIIPGPVELETDCLSACKAIKNGAKERSSYAMLLVEIQELINELREVDILHSNKACTEPFSKVWLRSCPDFAAAALAADCNPVVA